MYEDFIFCCNALHLTRTVKWVITRHSAIPPKFDFSDKKTLTDAFSNLRASFSHCEKIVKKYMRWAEKSVFTTKLGPKDPPKGLYGLILVSACFCFVLTSMLH